MFCHNCGKELPVDSLFCTVCGTKLKMVSTEFVINKEEADIDREKSISKFKKTDEKRYVNITNNKLIGIIVVIAVACISVLLISSILTKNEGKFEKQKESHNTENEVYEEADTKQEIINYDDNKHEPFEIEDDEIIIRTDDTSGEDISEGNLLDTDSKEREDGITKNDFYYDFGFDNLYEIKVGEEVGIFTNVTDDNNNIVNHGKTTFKIEEYYRFEGNTSFPQKDGYEWCYFKYVSPINSASEGYVPTEIVSCINEFKNPVWKGKPDDEGFYTFGLSIDEKEFNDCLFTYNDYYTKTDDVSECWFRVPQGYDGIAIIYGCLTAGQYKQRNGKLPDYSTDLITEDVKFFRLVASGVTTKDCGTESYIDDLSGDYDWIDERDTFIRIKKNNHLWDYLELDKETEKIHDVRQYYMKDDHTWYCITANCEECYIKQDDVGSISRVEVDNEELLAKR